MHLASFCTLSSSVSGIQLIVVSIWMYSHPVSECDGSDVSAVDKEKDGMGMLQISSDLADCCPATLTDCVRPQRNDSIQEKAVPSTAYDRRRRSSRISRSTVSNAADKSSMQNSVTGVWSSGRQTNRATANWATNFGRLGDTFWSTGRQSHNNGSRMNNGSLSSIKQASNR